MAWRPGQREAQRALEAPYENVPDHLANPLWAWIDEWLDDPETVRRMGIHLRVPLPDPNYGIHGHRDARDLLRKACWENTALFLDLVEALLGLYGPRGSWQGLQLTLNLGNSAYSVREDRRGLEFRVLPEVKAQVQGIVNAATGSAGGHLAAAWAEAYGRTSDPVKAYSEAIKAVEAAAAPVISPTNSKATLGTMIKDIENKPSKWTFSVSSSGTDGVEKVKDMMSLLWTGQTSRHGGVGPTIPETADAARTAVHLAATLVQFLISGALAEA